MHRLKQRQIVPKPSAPPLSESQIILLDDDSENPRPSAPRYESIINLNELWRTSYSNLASISTPPVSDGSNKDASAPFMREESIRHLIQSQYNIEPNVIKLRDQPKLPFREVKKVQQPIKINRR